MKPVLLSLLMLISVITPAIGDVEECPNVIFVLADDLGWSELGCYGNRFNETPHLDQLAKDGMRFTHAYAAAPVCSPYRAALLTGQHPARIGIVDYLRPNSANALSTDHLTLPEMLQRQGYETGMIGKWHLTGYRYHAAEHEVKPREHGFSWDIAREVKGVGNGANFWPYVFRTQKIRWVDIPENRLGKKEFLVDRMNLEAVNFIERNRKRPFFLYLSHYATHTILNGKPELVAKYRKKHPPGRSTRHKCYLCQDQGHPGDKLNHWAGDHNPHLAAMLESIDDGIGMIRAKLKELGLDRNTIIIFTSDNGGETNVTSNAPLRGGKSQLYEGGIRVPLVVSWPGQIPAGAMCDQPTVNVDFYPTLLQAARIKPAPRQVLDGASTLATWKNPKAPIERDALFWHYPLDRPHFLGGRSSGAIRQGDWKLIDFLDDGTTELYHLGDDPSEKKNLAAKKPAVVKALRAKLATWRRSVEARMPSPPLLAEPRKLYFADHFSTGQVSSRWWFNKDWSAEKGVLQRGEKGKKTTRIFLREAKYRDVIVRFDFQFQTAKDLRLVTGSGGHYNAVIHLRRDHFYVQTALDRTGPWFSYRHGECAFDFRPNQWYTMTVEIIGDELVAHVDHEHLAYAKHPILNKDRLYFAFQVDQGTAAFDNVQILTAAKHRDRVKNLKHVKAASGKHPVNKSIQEQFAIQKSNAHEWHYQRDAEYRKLTLRVAELDARNRKLYPDVLRTHKEHRKEISQRRKKLLKEDPKYKELLFATHRATRALDEYLVTQSPEVAKLPDSRRRREMERLRQRHQKDAGYLRLLARQSAAQEKLEKSYPNLFVTDHEISRAQKAQRKARENDPAFRKRLKERADAWRAQQDYLFKIDTKLAELQRKLKEE